MISKLILATAVAFSLGMNAARAQEPILGEIRMFAGSYPPAGWALCNGQSLSINANKELFALLGKTYGGDETAFALPDLQGRVPVGAGQGPGLANYEIGQKGGSETTTLDSSNIPQVEGEMPAFSKDPENKEAPEAKPGTAFLATGLEPNGNIEIWGGGAQPFENRQPYTTVTFVISLTGQAPSPDGKQAGNPYFGEIRMFAGKVAPAGWRLCNGDLLRTTEKPTFFRIMGNKYGGDGKKDFALPDFRGRVAVHAGKGNGLTDYPLGRNQGGTESTTLDHASIPSRVQQIPASTPGAEDKEFEPGNKALLAAGLDKNGSIKAPIANEAKPFSNMQPFTTVNYIIADAGVFPAAGDGGSSNDGYLGEIRMFAGDVVPAGWASCDGQEMSISQNSALYSLLGATYGGDGTTIMAVPDLRGRVAVHFGQGKDLGAYNLGEQGGTENTSLTNQNLPATLYKVPTLSPGLDGGALPEFKHGYSALLSTGLAPDTFIANGKAQNATPFTNIQPFLTVKFNICVSGIFPTRD